MCVVMTLGKEYAMTVNKSLQAVLLDLFPGYNGATHTTGTTEQYYHDYYGNTYV